MPVLLDTSIQWLFHKSRIRRWPKERGSYMELTISDSSVQLRQSRDEILSNALRELALFFPALREAKLLKSGILKDARATFSVTPGLDAHRPSQQTPWAGLFVAGDWTATGWPSTMEGARAQRLSSCRSHCKAGWIGEELPAARSAGSRADATPIAPRVRHRRQQRSRPASAFYPRSPSGRTSLQQRSR